MNYIILGDVHGHIDNIREFLNEEGILVGDERIDFDTKVYSVGDLWDGMFNKEGDHELLTYAPMWFDKVVIGNHEYAFMGGPSFGERKWDHALRAGLLDLEDEGFLVPSLRMGKYLVIHGGISDRLPFGDEDHAHRFITEIWNDIDGRENLAETLFDWIGPSRRGYNPYGGIIWQGWEDPYNEKLNQIVGHTPYNYGPISREFENGKVHWNIDGNGKSGKIVTGLRYDDETDEAQPFRWEPYTGRTETEQELLDEFFGHINEDDYEYIGGTD